MPNFFLCGIGPKIDGIHLLSAGNSREVRSTYNHPFKVAHSIVVKKAEHRAKWGR